jgi:hypothetical protein
VRRLAEATGHTVTNLPESLGGVAVDLVDPSGTPVRVVADTQDLAGMPAQEPLPLNFGHDVRRPTPPNDRPGSRPRSSGSDTS